MFDRDKWLEIFLTIRKNKLRTFLTSFSVFWGIFMLIILLGAGQGLQNGFEHDFKEDAANSIWIWGGQTSIAHKGMQPGKNIILTNEDYEYISKNIKGAEFVAGRIDKWSGALVTYKDKFGNFNVRAVHPDYKKLENATVKKGRFVNLEDLNSIRKVVVIGAPVRDALFKSEDPIGKYVKINKVSFKIVGIFDDPGSEGDTERLYIPATTAQRVFNGKNEITAIGLTTGNLAIDRTEVIEGQLKKYLAQKHVFSLEDERAISVWNQNKTYEMVSNIFAGIKLFVFIIGFMTIVAGIVGISNIMLIVVKERTKEIGIRKALGATPWSVISLILQESIVITSVAGYVGLMGGILLLEGVTKIAGLDQPGPFMRPEININLAIGATLLLIIAGGLAGLIPALKAAKIRPIVALRDE